MGIQGKDTETTPVHLCFLSENIGYRRNKFGRILEGQFVKIFMIKIFKLLIGNAAVKKRI